MRRETKLKKKKDETEEEEEEEEEEEGRKKKKEERKKKKILEGTSRGCARKGKHVVRRFVLKPTLFFSTSSFPPPLLLLLLVVVLLLLLLFPPPPPSLLLVLSFSFSFFFFFFFFFSFFFSFFFFFSSSSSSSSSASALSIMYWTPVPLARDNLLPFSSALQLKSPSGHEMVSRARAIVWITTLRPRRRSLVRHDRSEISDVPVPFVSCRSFVLLFSRFLCLCYAF
mgnify:CR=1 FL=1